MREACCRNRCGRYMGRMLGCGLRAMRRKQMSPGSHHERRRLGQQRQSEMSSRYTRGCCARLEQLRQQPCR